MPITKLKTDIQKVSHIIHAADIHIRLTKRHDEYEQIFDKLYVEIKKQPENTLICILGDIFHNKSELSPECVQSAKDLFWNLAELRPTILVAGNHDATLTNRNRLDSLSPLVEALNHRNLHYLKASGLYSFGNLLLNNMSIFDSPDKYLRFKDIPTIYKNQHEKCIALFHGQVDNALTDLGYKISSKAHSLSLFEGHDIALLGDIHLMQDLQHYDPDEGLPFVHFCGSLVQQNHGEMLKGHGYSLWDLKKNSYRHIEIPNDYGYFTIDVEKGKLNTDLKDIPKKARLRIRCFESVATEVKAVLAAVRQASDVNEVVYVRVESPNDKKSLSIIGNILSGDLTSVDYQNKLITDYLKKKMEVKDKETIEAVLKVNAGINTMFKKDEFSRNIRWRPKLFEFDNMFSYGEGNVIDFSKLSDVVGVFAPNASGKSSILSALSFCIFDKCDRAFKASHILNSQKMGFRCKFNFEINGIDYFIERWGNSDKKGNVKVSVKFWKVENDTEIELHGEGRRDTNEVIRDYLGSYDDFVLTALSVQNVKNSNSFIDMGHTERKDLLSQFIGLTVFDKLYTLSYDKYKELGFLLREYKNDDFTQQLVVLSDTQSQTQSSLNDQSRIATDITAERDRFQAAILEETRKLVNVSVKVDPIDKLLKRKQNLEALAASGDSKHRELVENKRELDGQLNKLNAVLLDLENKRVEPLHEEYLSLDREWNTLKNTIDRRKIEIKNKLEKLDKLSKQIFDPRCRDCIFIKDAFKTKDNLREDKVEADALVAQYTSVTEKRQKLMWVVEDYTAYDVGKDQKAKIVEQMGRLTSQIADWDKRLTTTKSDLEKVNKDIDIYHQNQKDIENNDAVEKKIGELKQSLVNQEHELKKINKQILELNGKLSVLKTQIEEIKRKVEKAKVVEKEFDAYAMYVQAVSRDGIPYEVISATVPEIEREVNTILSQIVEFTISIETDGKNVVSYIVYDKNRWPLELSSGLERFIASLAIRVALINVSNLPRPNFLCIDEGFGCADADNMASMSTLFAYLKTNFDFVLVVSHLDALKDMVDKHIEIKKESGFSKVNFV